MYCVWCKPASQHAVLVSVLTLHVSLCACACLYVWTWSRVLAWLLFALGAEEIDPYDLIEATAVLEKLPKDFFEKVVRKDLYC